MYTRFLQRELLVFLILIISSMFIGSISRYDNDDDGDC